MSGGLSGLHTQTLGKTAIYLPAVDSTNLYLKENGEKLENGTLCYTGWQTKGRGRLGRDWSAGQGQTLAMSLLFKPAEGLAQLPLACGLAVVNALQLLTGTAFQIKWPNDIVCGGHKICGILCESCLQENGSFTIAGIGVNLLQTEADFEQQGLPFAASVDMMTGCRLSVEETAAAVVNELEPVWLRLRERGFRAIREDYTAKCVNIGQKVRVLSPDGRMKSEGRAAGVADDGCLLIDDGDKVTAVNAGEVSVRGFYGYV